MKKTIIPYGEENNPGPAWRGILKIIGIAGCTAVVLGGLVILVIWLSNNQDRQQQVVVKKAVDSHLVAQVEHVVSLNDEFVLVKITFDGHVYIGRDGYSLIHSESCLCKAK